MSDPTPEQVDAAMERIKCALFPQEDFCWRMEQDDTDECGCLPCIPESLATLRARIERQDAVIEDLRQAASVACIGYELPGLASALRRTAR